MLADNQKQPKKSCLNVNEEYLCAVRTKSFADFFCKVQFIFNKPSSSSSSANSGSSETGLLNPAQETIAAILQSSPALSAPGLKSILSNYFEVSAQASDFCRHLLDTLNRVWSDYAVINRLISDDDQLGSAAAELRSRGPILSDPFSEQDFRQIHERHSSVLHGLKSRRRRVDRQIKLIKYFNRASGVCAAAAGGLVAAAAVAVALHTLAGLLMGPALMFAIPAKKKIKKIRFLRYGSLRRVVKQLDAAEKGAYILNRDFDTMGRLVSRLQDEIEHSRVLIEFCLDRSGQAGRHMLKVVKKYEAGFRKQVEELEEHVFLCLITINRTRALVVDEICSDSAGAGEKSVR